MSRMCGIVRTRFAIFLMAVLAVFPSAAAGESRPTVAVLSAAPSNASLEERVRDAAVRRVLTNQVAELGVFNVASFGQASRTGFPPPSGASGRGVSAYASKAALELSADLVFWATVSERGGRWRVRSQLYHLAQDRLRSGPSGTVEFEELHTLLSSIARAAAQSLDYEVTGRDVVGLNRTTTKDPLAFTALGRSLIAPPTSRQAEFSALQAVERDPEFVEGYMQLGALYYTRGQYDTALDAFERAAAVRPETPYVDFNIGLAHRALGQYEESVEAYERARLVTPNDVDVMNNLGAVYYMAGRLEEARQAFHDALALAPFDPKARANLKAVEQAMRAPVFTPDADPAVASAPTTPAAQPQAGPAATPLSAAATRQVHVDAGAIFSSQGEYERAIGEYLAALESDPRDHGVRTELARAYYRSGRFDESLDELSLVLESSPLDPDAHELFQKVLTAERVEPAAANSVEGTTRELTDVEVGQTFFRKGRRHFVRGEYDAAVVAYERALERLPNDTDLLNSLGTAQFNVGNADDARSTFESALELDPDDGVTLQNLVAIDAAADRSRVERAATDDDLALIRLNVDIALAPEVAFLDGNQAYAAGDYAGAEDAFRRAVALRPDHGKAWNNLGAALLHLGNPTEATKAFEQASLHLDDETINTNAEMSRLLAKYESADGNGTEATIALEADPELNYRYLMAFAREAYDGGDYGMAASRYEDIAAMYRDRVLPMTNLSASYYMLGRSDDAYAAAQLALRLNPEDDVTKQNLKTIEKARFVETREEKATAPVTLTALVAQGEEAQTASPVTNLSLEEPIDATMHLEFAAKPTATSQSQSTLYLTLDEANDALAAGELAEAEEGFRTVVLAAPENFEALRGLATVWTSTGRWPDAADAAARAAAVRPKEYRTLMAWGYAALRAERPDDARRAFRQATTVDTEASAAFYNLALAERRAGDVAAAVTANERALALDGAFTDAHYNLGNLYLETQRWDQAIAAFRRVLEQDTSHLGAYNNLAIAHWRINERAEALTLWRQALAVDPNCTFAQVNLDRFSQAEVSTN